MNYVTQNVTLPDFEVRTGEVLIKPQARYTCYGDLGNSKPRALIFHGCSSCSELHTWWEKFNFQEMLQYYNIICINSLSSSHGTTGPESLNPVTSKPYLNAFPEISIQDTVDFAVHTLTHLEINSLELVLGCSLGGMQALDMYLRYPEISKRFISVAGVPVPKMTRLTNLAQATLIDKAISLSKSKEDIENALGASRFFFRLSCTNEQALNILDEKCHKEGEFPTLLEYFTQDNDKFQKEFSPYSNSLILKMIANFEVSNTLSNNKMVPDLTIVSIEDDIFTPEESVRLVHETLRKDNQKVIYRTFKTNFGHEAWIVDGKRFYEFIKEDLYI